MARFFFNFGKLLVFSRRHKNVRQGLIGIFTNLLFLAAVVFSVEIALILLGVGDVFVPLTSATRSLISRLIF